VYCVQLFSIAFLRHQELLLEEMFQVTVQKQTRQKRTFKQEFEKHL